MEQGSLVVKVRRHSRKVTKETKRKTHNGIKFRELHVK
jgi:hypothetical protein